MVWEPYAKVHVHKQFEEAIGQAYFRLMSQLYTRACCKAGVQDPRLYRIKVQVLHDTTERYNVWYEVALFPGLSPQGLSTNAGMRRPGNEARYEPGTVAITG